MLKKILTAGSAALLLMVSGCGTAATSPNVPDDANQTNDEPLVTIQNDYAGYEVTYPKEFTVTNGEDSNADYRFITGYHITDNPSGEPGKERDFPFEMEIKFVSTSTKIDLPTTLKITSPAFEQAYKDYKAGKTDYRDIMSTTTVDGREAYRFTIGAEGTNVQYVFIPKTDRQLIIARLSYIGDIMVKNILPKPISEQEQLTTFDNLLKSFIFTK